MCIVETRNNNNNNKDKPRLRSAPPPWHSVVLTVCFTCYFLYHFPTTELLQQQQDEASSSFKTSLYIINISETTLGIVRAACAVVIFTTSLLCVVGPGWEILPPYLPSTKLQRVPIRIKGYKTMLPFTSWCWNLLGVSFALNSYLALSQSSSTTNPFLRGVATLLWDISAPCALLVSAVVKHALWPAAVRQNTGHSLNSCRNLLMHNANAAFVLLEYGVLSGMPVYWKHCSVAPLWGVAYLVFTWNANMLWNPDSGPAYIYFFFDTTIGGYFHSMVILALLAVLLLCYGLFANTQYLLDEGGLATRLAFVGVVSLAVMRFRD